MTIDFFPNSDKMPDCESEMQRIDKIFIHTLLAKKSMTKVYALCLFNELCEKFELPAQDFAAFIRNVNNMFMQYDFSLKAGIDKDGKPVYCIVLSN